MDKNAKKLTLMSLILMIFTSVFGFGNMPRSFYLMGYSAIPWYVLAAITFFIPYAFMMAEFGAAFKDEKGGIYSWMEKSVGPKFAFVGTFMWYFSYVVWMVGVGTSVWIACSTAIFGKDTTESWGILGMNGTQMRGVLGILLIVLVTYVCTKGLDKIKKVTSIGGTAVAALNIILIVSALFLLITSGGHVAQPVDMQAFTTSPNPKYLSTISVFSFIIFAIFAYGGIEVVGGLVDQTENAEKTFPKGLAIAAIVISIGYAVGIFLFGTFTNWSEVLGVKGVHLGNFSIAVNTNLGTKIGLALGLSPAAAASVGVGYARTFSIVGLLTTAGAIFTLAFAPLKQLIEGTPAKLWPGKMGQLDEKGMPKNAMWYQALIVCAFIGLISFGGDNATAFFDKITLMTNVAMTIPYMFLSIAFMAFKKKESIKKPFEVYKNKTVTVFAGIMVTLTIGIANVFSIIEPAIKNNDYQSSAWSIGGPLFFGVVAFVMYTIYEKRYGRETLSKEKSA